jgi:hypothetical protein
LGVIADKHSLDDNAGVSGGQGMIEVMRVDHSVRGVWSPSLVDLVSGDEVAKITRVETYKLVVSLQSSITDSIAQL